MRKTLSLRALIFDLDGTLVDSRLDFAAMRSEIGAPEGIGLLEYIDGLPSPDDRDRAMDVVHRHELAGARAATWMPGAREALVALVERGLPLGIVTRNSGEAARLTMERLQIPSIPLKAREDAAPKPDPEALLMLTREWRLAPSHCAYVGDFRYDIEAAERAGMQPILYVGDGPVPREHEGQVPILRDFRDLPGWLAP